MKCELCSGKGWLRGHPLGIQIACPVCVGKGYVEQTNEEWLHTLNTEEKAFALETIIRSVLVQRSPMCHDVCNREFWERWLKEIHKE